MSRPKLSAQERRLKEVKEHFWDAQSADLNDSALHCAAMGVKLVEGMPEKLSDRETLENIGKLLVILASAVAEIYYVLDIYSCSRNSELHVERAEQVESLAVRQIEEEDHDKLERLKRKEERLKRKTNIS